MSSPETDMDRLEEALRSFFQSMKNPQRWTQVTQAAGIQLDRPAGTILHVLAHHLPKQLRVQDLASILGIEPPSVTRKTQELEQAGYLERVPDPQDRRAVSLHLTPAGLKVANKLAKIQQDALKTAFAGWSASERQQFASLLERLTQDLSLSYNTTKKGN
jgi:DNA-binding MarR family transcriptional regulator